MQRVLTKTRTWPFINTEGEVLRPTIAGPRSGSFLLKRVAKHLEMGSGICSLNTNRGQKERRHLSWHSWNPIHILPNAHNPCKVQKKRLKAAGGRRARSYSTAYPMDTS